MKILEGKTALITGGSRGIGESIVRKFIDQGADVVFTFRSSESEAQSIVDELKTKNQSIYSHQSDASDFEQAKETIEFAIEKLGHIDILINNAGITQDNLMLRMSEDQWDHVINVNLKSVFNLTKHALRPMLKNKKGSIINMSSVVGSFGNAGQANYAASKAGIHGFTKSIAKEIGSRNIRCNAITPGFIRTNMTDKLDDKTKENYINSIPLKRFGEAEEIANACVFLGSDNSKYITGQIISVCGGMNV